MDQGNQHRVGKRQTERRTEREKPSAGRNEVAKNSNEPRERTRKNEPARTNQTNPRLSLEHQANLATMGALSEAKWVPQVSISHLGSLRF